MQFFRESHKPEYAHFQRQRDLIARAYPFFKCEVSCDVLTCHAKIIPSEGCASYSISIKYKLHNSPCVRVLNPKIPKELWGQVHIFSQTGDLCLFDSRKGKQPWQWKYNIHETIIPWTAEWLVYYELYLKLGKWLGPEVIHEKPKVLNRS
jgi:hypothetical protein